MPNIIVDIVQSTTGLYATCSPSTNIVEENNVLVEIVNTEKILLSDLPDDILSMISGVDVSISGGYFIETSSSNGTTYISVTGLTESVTASNGLQSVISTGTNNNFIYNIETTGVLLDLSQNLTASAVELNYLDGAIPGVATSGKAFVFDSNLTISGVNEFITQSLVVENSLTSSGTTYIFGSLVDSTPSSGDPGQILSSTGSGILWVDPFSSVSGLNDLYDVNTSGAVDNNLLVYDLSNDLWQPTSGLYYVDGNLGLGRSNPTYNLEVAGSFSAQTKSFKIDHPAKKGSFLEYGSLESPYHGIRLTGKGKTKKGKCKVKLPKYIKKLVKEEDINIQLTNYRHGKILFVQKIDISKNSFTIKVAEHEKGEELEFFWDFTAIRKDVPDLIVEK